MEMFLQRIANLEGLVTTDVTDIADYLKSYKRSGCKYNLSYHDGYDPAQHETRAEAHQALLVGEATVTIGAEFK